MKLYNYIFYKIYKSFYKFYGDNGDPAFKAMALFSISIMLYIFNIFSFSEYIIGKINITNFNTKIIGGGTVLFLFAINYFLFVYKDRSDDIKRSFDKEPLLPITASRLLMIVFFSLPFAGIVVLIYLHRH